MGSDVLNELADELLEVAVLEFDQDAVVFTMQDDEVLVREPYQELRNRIYDVLDNNLNGD